MGWGCGSIPNWVSSLSVSANSYLTLHPVGDILEINFLKEKSLSKSSFLIFLCKEPEPVLLTLGLLGSWDISTDSGGWRW